MPLPSNEEIDAQIARQQDSTGELREATELRRELKALGKRLVAAAIPVAEKLILELAMRALASQSRDYDD